MPSFEFIKTKLLPQAVAAGGFGAKAEFVEVIQDETKGADQFASAIEFLEIKVKVDGVPKEFAVVCKFQVDDKEHRELFLSDQQFFNEVLVFKEIVPMFSNRAVDLLPRFFYGRATLGESFEEDTVIIENLIPQGYRHSSERIHLDYDHCALVFKKLGEFHGASLQAKAKNPLKFAHKINQLMETRWIPDDKEKDDKSYFFSENAKRGINPLLKNSELAKPINAFLDKLTDVYGMIKDILDVNEMSVLCHGDFCRNNMVFKYEGERVIDVKFFDLATARYASPVIDISFFLFLNTSVELRRKHFKDDLLNIYLKALQGAAGSSAPSKAELWQEFQKKAVYGYILIAFFLPVMMRDPEDVLSFNFQDTTPEQRVQINLARGGQKVTDILVQSVEDLVKWGCFD